MDIIYYIDYLANFHPNIFRRGRAAYKLIFTAVLIAGAISARGGSRNIFWLLGVYLFLIFLIFLMKLPVLKIWLFSLYPLIFILVFLYASGFKDAFLVLLRVNSISLAVIFLIITTSYPKIFHALGHFLPRLFVSALFLTYRAIFIFLDLAGDLKNSFFLRGAFDRRRPVKSLRNLAAVFGFMFVRAADISEKMADSMRLRGFSGKIHYHEEAAHYWGILEPANMLVLGLSFLFVFSYLFVIL
ncbi:MAG: energy-coupling factor transporter transmembrane component T [bacterium]|nr:energy-coupling factor transporter transmembrane component T [bacterium]